ncbi:serine hydrolase domain-containing protein [Rhodococcus jostii]|uniref:serine hydrolase domain-containing protein n=1 Tax=Rhodococcus jostii TaxID=132919 RepID=UPI00362AC8EF
MCGEQKCASMASQSTGREAVAATTSVRQWQISTWRAAALLVLCLGLTIGPLTPVAAAEPSAGSSLSESTWPRIDTIVAQQLQATKTPGAIVEIQSPKLGTYSRGYGFADPFRLRLMSTTDHYRIGSVTKTFTANAVLQLIDRRRLSLDDPLDNFVDGIPYGHDITIGDLLGMRGGVYDYTADPQFLEEYTQTPRMPDWNPQKAVDIIDRHAADARPPGQATVYSNSNYVLLGMVIEKLTGARADDYITDHVIASLGLANSLIPIGLHMPAPASSGYAVAENTVRDVTASNPHVPWTAGSAVSTISDLTTYARQLAAGDLLSPESQRARMAFTPLPEYGDNVSYGLGIMKIGQWVGHGGGTWGYTNMVFYLPSADATIAVAVNAGDMTGAQVAWALWTDLVNALYPNSLS